MTEISARDDPGSQPPPRWIIEIQPGMEGVPPALIIEGDTGTVTIPLSEAIEFYNELMAAATRLAAIEAETEEREN